LEGKLDRIARNTKVEKTEKLEQKKAQLEIRLRNIRNKNRTYLFIFSFFLSPSLFTFPSSPCYFFVPFFESI